MGQVLEFKRREPTFLDQLKVDTAFWQSITERNEKLLNECAVVLEQLERNRAMWLASIKASYDV